MNPLRRVQKFLVRVLSTIALVLAWVLSFLFYFLILGPYAIVLKVAMGDILEEKVDPRQKTYWKKLDPTRPRPNRPF